MGGDNLERAGRCIRTDWRRQRHAGQRAWCYVFDEGLVSTKTAREWRARIWGSNLDYPSF